MAAESEYAETARQIIADFIVAVTRFCVKTTGVAANDELAFVLGQGTTFLAARAYRLADSQGHCPECNAWTTVADWRSNSPRLTLGCGHTVGIPEFLSELGKKKPAARTDDIEQVATH